MSRKGVLLLLHLVRMLRLLCPKQLFWHIRKAAPHKWWGRVTVWRHTWIGYWVTRLQGACEDYLIQGWKFNTRVVVLDTRRRCL